MSSPSPIRELIPGRLVWAPEQCPGQVSGCQTIDAFDLCHHGAAKGSAAGTYVIRHYTEAACGCAFGPLGLESLLRFCRGLAVRLEGLQPGGGAFALVTSTENKERRANAAVLVGAYLVLRHGWSAANLAARLGEEDAGAKFACSWERKGRPPAERVMRVHDCWAGIELAKLKGWIDPAIIEDDPKTDMACAKHDGQLTFYDTAWIIPGMLMVGADPVTVVCDPNPATCSQMFPVDDSGSNSPRSTDSFLGKVDDGANSVCDSLDTVCKEYTNPAGDLAKEEDAGADTKREGQDFTSFLMRSGIGLIVRANFDDEAGMPGRKSYGEHAFEVYGFAQANVRVVDKKGAIPRPSDVARMLEACEGFMQRTGEEAVLVHCKGGFGRSDVLACCLAISRLDVPGAALLGWARVARPGAVTTRAQELFLASLKGRKDVLRYAQVPIVEGPSGGVKPTCGKPCQIQ